MRARELRERIEGTLDDFEDRAYLGMSQIWKCPRELFYDMTRGRPRPGLEALKLMHEGYVHQADVLARLEAAGLAIEGQEMELAAEWDERFRGHIDGELIEDETRALLEIKSVTRDRFERIMRSRWPRRHLDQLEMYMRYGGYGNCMIVYKCREDGDLWVVEIEPDVARADELEGKARAVLAAVDAGVAPGCTCGRCR